MPCLGEGKLCLSECKLRLGKAHLRLGQPGDFCRHCFPIVLIIVQVGSYGGTSHAKGTLSDFRKLWVPVNGTQQCGIGLLDIHMISTS